MVGQKGCHCLAPDASQRSAALRDHVSWRLFSVLATLAAIWRPSTGLVIVRTILYGVELLTSAILEATFPVFVDATQLLLHFLRRDDGCLTRRTSGLRVTNKVPGKITRAVFARIPSRLLFIQRVDAQTLTSNSLRLPTEIHIFTSFAPPSATQFCGRSAVYFLTSYGTSPAVCRW